MASLVQVDMSLYKSTNSLENESSTDSSELDDMGDLFRLSLIMETERSFIHRTPCRTSLLTGKMYTLEFMLGHESICYDNFRMKKDVFVNFCQTLKDVGNLKGGKKVSLEEAVAMFLFIVGHNTRQRIVADRFQHSLHTVSKWFKIVLRAVCKLGKSIIRPRSQTTTHPYIMGNNKYYPYFKNCIGAIDGTHVAAYAPASKQNAFRGRKALVTQNVLAICDFDMLFTFVYTGWEGTANDSRVFLDALSPGNNFPKPHGDQYYLVDSGFPNMSGYLAPFRRQRYHLRDYRDRGKHELFNYRHSSLRNIIERSFGVLKARFPILKMMPSYPIRRQRLIPIACCIIHNFIRLQHMQHATDSLFNQYDGDELIVDGEGSTMDQQGINVDVDVDQIIQMGQVRDTIMDQMFASYRRI